MKVLYVKRGSWGLKKGFLGGDEGTGGSSWVTKGEGSWKGPWESESLSLGLFLFVWALSSDIVLLLRNK